MLGEGPRQVFFHMGVWPPSTNCHCTNLRSPPAAGPRRSRPPGTPGCPRLADALRRRRRWDVLFAALPPRMCVCRAAARPPARFGNVLLAVSCALHQATLPHELGPRGARFQKAEVKQ